ncbi:MAG: choline/ethanolamine kinase family protein [Anaerolineales bacterium]
MTPSIEEVIQHIPEWKDKKVVQVPLGGGLTNTNFRVEVEGTPFFVRIPGESTQLLAIDRENEVHNTRAAAAAGVAPRVIHHWPEPHVMVLEFLPGATLSQATMQAPGMPVRIASVMRRLHTARRFRADFDMFRLVETYLATADENAVTIPPDYRTRLPTVARMQAAMGRHPQPSVPCHNDLLPENFLLDGDRLWLVDFEYSGNNDPSFELGNTCQELQYRDEQVEELCQAYYGTARPSLLGRMKLWAIMSDVGWTLWGAIQAKISRLDFDFWGYAMGRWERGSAMMDSAEFPRWLEDVQTSAGVGGP